jgi:hypothetical protein
MSGAFSRQYEDADLIPGQPIPIKPAVPKAGEYPVDALSPKLRAATLAIMDKVQVPAAIAAQSILSAAALGVQAFVDVRLPTGEVIPSSIFAITVAASGDRKSSSDKLALHAIREREARMHDDWQIAQTAYLADKAAYGAAHKKATSTAGNRNRRDIREDLERLGPEPIAPPLPMLVSDEGTLQGLQKLFADAMPSLGLFSDEGGQWLGGFAMAEEQRGQTGAALSKLWDGSPIKRVRGTDGVTILRGRRLSLHLMIQHRIAKRLLSDPDLKDQGLLSRILVCQPETMKGQRMWRDPDANSDLDLEKFDAKLYGLLSGEMPMDPQTRALTPKIIDLSPDAKEMFRQWHDAVEVELRPGGMFDDITGFAAKLPEHSVRIAAVMAYFEDRQTVQISATALSAGIKLAKFYAMEALRLIGIGTADEDSENAAALIAWIRDKGHRIVGKKWLSNNVIPKSIRPAPPLSRAIEILIEHGHLVPIKGGAHMRLGEKEQFFKDAYTVIEDAAE